MAVPRSREEMLRAAKTRKRVGDAGVQATRWTRVCAWDGQELGDEDFVQVSAHERVCQAHYQQFQTWLRDTAKTIYHLRPEDDEGTDERLGTAGSPRARSNRRRRRSGLMLGLRQRR